MMRRASLFSYFIEMQVNTRLLATMSGLSFALRKWERLASIFSDEDTSARCGIVANFRVYLLK